MYFIIFAKFHKKQMKNLDVYRFQIQNYITVWVYQNFHKRKENDGKINISIYIYTWLIL